MKIAFKPSSFARGRRCPAKAGFQSIFMNIKEFIGPMQNAHVTIGLACCPLSPSAGYK